jgi:hypothetical protein
MVEGRLNFRQLAMLAMLVRRVAMDELGKVQSTEAFAV